MDRGLEIYAPALYSLFIVLKQNPLIAATRHEHRYNASPYRLATGGLNLPGRSIFQVTRWSGTKFN
jgi:hypothetical protein